MKVRLGSESISGFTLLELIAVLGFFAICLGIVILNLKKLENPLANGTAELVSYLKQVRATAISSTSAYTVSAVSPSRIKAVYGTTCTDASTTPDNRLMLELPNQVQLTDTSWTVCFSSRGLASANPEIPLRDHEYNLKTVKVYMGGGIRVL